MSKTLSLLILELLSPFAFGGIYKCMQVDKKISYQDSPCDSAQNTISTKVNAPIQYNPSSFNGNSQDLKGCEDIKNISLKAAELANAGVSVKEAKAAINNPKFDKTITLVYEGSNAQERQRTVNDIYMACQDKRSGKKMQSHWTKEEYKQVFFKSCTNSKSTNTTDSKSEFNCNCFSNVLIDSMPDSDLEKARENPAVFNNFIKSNPNLFIKCGQK